MKNIQKLIAVLSAVFVFGLVSQGAQAQVYSCTDSTYGASSTYTTSSCSTNNTAAQSSTVATSTAVLKAAATQSARLVSNRVSNALSGGSAFSADGNGFSASGMSGGDHNGKVGVWVSGTWSGVEDDNTSTQFDGNVYSGMVGVDYRVNSKTVIGLGIGYENTDIDTQYNGFNGQDGNLEANGYTIAPYIGVELSENASASLTVGYSDLEYDTLRFDPNVGNRITGSTDAERYFVDASVQGSRMMDDNWHLRGKGSVFFASEEKDAFTETESNGSTTANSEQDNDFGQVSAEARLGYVMNNVEPYGLIGVEYDFTKDEAPVAAGQSRSSLDDEDFGAKIGAGLDFQIAPNVTGGIEGYTVEFRDDYSEYTVSGGLRFKF